MPTTAPTRTGLPLLLLATLAGGCPETRTPLDPLAAVSDDPVAEREFKAARGLFESGEWDFAERAFGQFVVDRPGDPLVRTAAIFRARIALERGDPDRARELLAPVLGSPGALGDRAALFDGIALQRLGRNREAIGQLERFRGRLTTTAENGLLLESLWRAYRDAGEPALAVARLDEQLAAGAPDEEDPEPRRALAEIVDGLGEIEVLKRLASELPEGRLAWSLVQARLAGLYYEAGELALAAAIIAAIRARGGEEHPAVEEIAGLVERRTVVDLGSIGCILPLSGRSRLVGEAVLKGVMLGARTARLGPKRQPLAVVIRDTGGDPDQAARAVEQLVLEDHVAAIVGPAEGEEAVAAARRAEELGVPLLALTMRVDVARAGPHVFREFTSSEAEVRALADAARRLGGRSFAVLQPNDAYGRSLGQAFAAELARRGERPVCVVEYDAAATTFREPVAELSRCAFDVLFVPERAARLALVAPALAAVGLWSTIPGESAPGPGRAVTVLAPSAGIAADLPRRAGRYLSGAIFATGFHADATSGSTRFAAEFRDEYRAEAGAFSAYGHDAALLIAAAISAGSRSRPAIRRWLDRADAATADEFPLAAPFTGFDEQGEARAAAVTLMLRGDRFEVLR
jgi:ABC-type branched-subunit amino acid transport system substrate-binding protein